MMGFVAQPNAAQTTATTQPSNGNGNGNGSPPGNGRWGGSGGNGQINPQTVWLLAAIVVLYYLWE